MSKKIACGIMSALLSKAHPALFTFLVDGIERAVISVEKVVQEIIDSERDKSIVDWRDATKQTDLLRNSWIVIHTLCCDARWPDGHKVHISEQVARYDYLINEIFTHMLRGQKMCRGFRQVEILGMVRGLLMTLKNEMEGFVSDTETSYRLSLVLSVSRY